MKDADHAPKEDIEKFVRPAWDETRVSITGGALEKLPGQSFNDVCHVRPHARNALDTFPTPLNGEQVKRSFWLDRRYIAAHIADLRVTSTA